MPTGKAEPLDVHSIKKVLMRATADNPVNCAVIKISGGEASLAVDNKKPARRLAAELKKEHGGGPTAWGTASSDEFPGELHLVLNRDLGSGMARLLTHAVRGSGYRKVVITVHAVEELDA